MNKKYFKENIATIIRFFPRPKEDGQYVTPSKNKWHVLEETENGKGYVFLNAVTNQEVMLEYDNINQYRTPDIVILRVQLCYDREGKVEYEPIAEPTVIPEMDDSAEIIKERTLHIRNNIQKLTESEVEGVRELIIRGGMTDTDMSEHLIRKGFNYLLPYYQTVYNKTGFLSINNKGEYSVKNLFRPIIKKLLFDSP